MNPLLATVEPLAVQGEVHRVGVGALAQSESVAPAGGEIDGVPAAAFEAGAVPSRERRHFVEEEELSVVAAPDVAMPVLEFEHAADPPPRRPAPTGEELVGGVNFPAAIAHEEPARRDSVKLSERIDPILQRHGAALARLDLRHDPITSE